MRRRSRTSAKFGATGVILGMGVFACVAWSMRLREEPATAEPLLSAADVVALRFPYELEEAAQPTATAKDEGDTATSSDADETLALFNPNPTYPTTTPSDAEVAPPTPASIPDATPAPVTSGTSELAAAATRRNYVRPSAVLSDGQIASIKRRLKLTPQQQQMWPAVEVALRSLSYPKKSDGSHKNGSAIDKNSPEVLQLTSAAYPLVMSFSDDQKRELHDIAHVAGLEQLVPKF
jgi:hypothetical protein